MKHATAKYRARLIKTNALPRGTGSPGLAIAAIEHSRAAHIDRVRFTQPHTPLAIAATQPDSSPPEAGR